MKRNRLLKAGLAVLVVTVVVVAGLWFLFVATPSPTESDLNATTPDPNLSTAPPEFTMTAAVTTQAIEEPSDTTNWSARVMYDSDAEERLGWLNSTIEDGEVSMGQYQRYSQNATQEYNRYHHPESDAFDSRVDSIRDDLDPETESLSVNDTSQTYVHYRKRPQSPFEVVPELMPPLGFIDRVPFEHDGSTTFRGNRVERYVPTSGWVQTPGTVDDDPDWYISNTSGELYVNKATGHIVHVNVSLTSKRTAIRAGKWFAEGGDRIQIRLTVREDVRDDDLRPAWAT
ncbi:hypothetical protein KY092_18130 [Natronomonas gomsonensis]|uniref:hypothetical protein n=1 Tax=Natronomonas gomsonensis TaxID=1046043 RepID=UPI0020CA4021|nr:hypothetical protein [Natronomonas gomsonensis]MCY4732463.1 hypothetical protein [Natronomonas gomsonensis]